MKYRAVNQLDCFEFHDTVFTFVRFDNDELVVSAKHLNIHKSTEQNTSDYDLEIDCAKIVFKGLQTHSFEPSREWKIDEKGNSYTNDPLIIFKGQEAEDKLMQEIRNGIKIYYFGRDGDSQYCIEGCGIDPFFTTKFSFDSVTVEWDGYLKKAWYEFHKQQQFEITLNTPVGEKNATVYIICSYEDESLYEDFVKQTVNVCIKYNGKELWGRGADYLWIDAFVNLQEQLPDGVTIKCCLTCKHGKFCPVENQLGELFCTKDVLFNEKSNLFFYTEDETERAKHSRNYTYVCKKYQPKSDE